MQRLIDRENKPVFCRHREKSERLTDRENERVTRQRLTDREKSDKETEKLESFIQRLTDRENERESCRQRPTDIENERELQTETHRQKK